MRNATLTAVRHATDLRRKADAKAQAAERDLHRAVLAAHADGWSYRAISEVAGISHQRVSQIVQASKAEAAEREAYSARKATRARKAPEARTPIVRTKAVQ